MELSFKPLTRRQRQDLEGYVAWSTTLFRAALFVSVVGFVGWFLRALLLRAAATYPAAAHPAWWVVPVLALAAGLLRLSRRWTGGRDLRARIRADLKRGDVAVRRIVAVDAIEIEAQADEGPTYFLLTGDGRTMVFAGQYLEPFVRRGFPWQAFDILEAPESRLFIGLTKAGDRLIPSGQHPPLTWEEVKSLGVLNERYRVVDREFASLKAAAQGSNGHAAVSRRGERASS
jgi:hypothetical protein